MKLPARTEDIGESRASQIIINLIFISHAVYISIIIHEIQIFHTKIVCVSNKIGISFTCWNALKWVGPLPEDGATSKLRLTFPYGKSYKVVRLDVWYNFKILAYDEAALSKWLL